MAFVRILLISSFYYFLLSSNRNGVFSSEAIVRSKWLEGGVNSLFKNVQASLNNHVSIKDG
jgi:hypothetical protein